MRKPPANAQTKRYVESEVRCSDDGDMTPMSAEYGMLIAAYATHMRP